MDDLNDPVRSPNQQVEKNPSKIEAMLQPRNQSINCLNFETYPSGVMIPADLDICNITMRFYHSYQQQYEMAYVHQSADYLQPGQQITLSRIDIDQMFTLLTRCHLVLRLRESTFFQAAQLLHVLFQKMNAQGNRDFPKILCALLFICQKYEPTDRSIYSVTQITHKLFGQTTQVKPDTILDCEQLVLELLDYRLETTSPYHLVHIYGQAAEFDAKKMNMVLYLISLAACCPEMQRFHPVSIAAASVSLVIDHYNMQWNQSLNFWTARKLHEIQEEKQLLKQIWLNAFEQGRLKQVNNQIYNKYADPRKFSVSLETPLYN
ncbi:Cyclin_A [Hexamita inflata]|uniref:Cyclin A n=1 Tax=Hexamita inflata TaxID=28002 RepID=A0AA86V8W7_9EUKA|nr:Cyclin A [Hexamita inflata]